MWLSGTGGACKDCPGGKYIAAGTDASPNLQCDDCPNGKFLLANIAQWILQVPFPARRGSMPRG